MKRYSCIGLVFHLYGSTKSVQLKTPQSIGLSVYVSFACSHTSNCQFLHDVFHVLFECPLFHKERVTLFQRIPAGMINNMFGVQPSLYELQISLLCPITCQAASAVGHFLACTIAKLGVFKQSG